MTTSHLWVRGDTRMARAEAVDALDLAQPLVTTAAVEGIPAGAVDAHARRRGPYTSVGTVLREIVPLALHACPELVHAHDVEILSAAPELRESVPASRETLTSLAIPAERTRFYSRLRTLRLAHGLCEFLRDALPLVTDGPRSLVVENIENADPTDAEAIAVFLRRLDPRAVQIVVCTSTDDADARLPKLLHDALSTHTTAMDTSGVLPGGPSGLQSVPPTTAVEPAVLARAYVASEGLTEDPRLLAAYESLSLEARAALHDARADALEASGERSFTLGAIPWHRERGSDPGTAGVEALRTALDYCIDMGFYDATVDLGVRGRAIVHDITEDDLWWTFTTKMTTSLAALGRAEEAEALYDEARAKTTYPLIHLQAAYATAMLYTRHHEQERRDDQAAKRWINEAIAISTLLPDKEMRAFNTVFNHNGLALIEVHLRNLPGALKLVDEGLQRLAAELDADKHKLHRSVLRYNRAQVYAGLGDLEKALEDYSAVIEIDPNYPEYYFDRSAIHRRLGDEASALTDIETAMRLSPPFPEVYYNRGDIRLSRGDVEGALADFAYTIELEPGFVDAYVNRAGVLFDRGDYEGAARDVAAGLSVDPDNAALLCVRGQLAAVSGSDTEARSAYDKALELDPKLRAAYAARADLLFEKGDLEAALADLDRAVELDDDAAIRYNRAVALRAANRAADALVDLDKALELTPDDDDVRVARDEVAALVAA